MGHIEARDITLTYDTPSGAVPGVHGVSFGMEVSGFLCIVGPSGCGKSTLLNIIAGFLTPDRLLGRECLCRYRHAAARPQQKRLPGSSHGREQHGGGACRQDGRRHGERRALSTASTANLMDFYPVDPMLVFMAATPDFVQDKPDTVIAYLKAWLDVAKDFKNDPQKIADVSYKFYADKGYNMSLDTFAKALSRVEVNPGFPGEQQQAQILLQDKKIGAIPDWSTALRPDFMERARAGA